MLKCAVMGLGQRGRLYCDCIHKSNDAELVAIIDPLKRMQEFAKNSYGLNADQIYNDDKEFYKQDKIADLLFISTQDHMHYEQALNALDLGYDIVLEKPIAISSEQCKEIANKANTLGRKIFVCHVLRYAPFFTEIKKLLVSGDLGEVMHIDHTELVGYWHQAHSFVRGNWRRKEDSNPMIVAKCCHDLDIIAWLMDKKAVKVSSFGSLGYFKKENAPEGSADYCFECPHEKDCHLSCLKFYTTWPDWLFFNIPDYQGEMNNKDDIIKNLSRKDVKYARCAFKCDNDVVDHQSVSALFEGGATAHLTMNGFNRGCYRTCEIYCTKGEIHANMDTNIIQWKKFDGSLYEDWHTIDLSEMGKHLSGHGGGDERMVADIINAMNGTSGSLSLTSINNSIMSHLMGFAAEDSRLENGKVIDIEY